MNEEFSWFKLFCCICLDLYDIFDEMFETIIKEIKSTFPFNFIIETVNIFTWLVYR